jgi:hypothetical protein
VGPSLRITSGSDVDISTSSEEESTLGSATVLILPTGYDMMSGYFRCANRMLILDFVSSASHDGWRWAVQAVMALPVT